MEILGRKSGRQVDDARHYRSAINAGVRLHASWHGIKGAGGVVSEQAGITGVDTIAIPAAKEKFSDDVFFPNAVLDNQIISSAQMPVEKSEDTRHIYVGIFIDEPWPGPGLDAAVVK